MSREELQSALSSSMCGFAPEIAAYTSNPQQQGTVKRKRNLPGTPGNPEAEVVALSPKTLMATNRFVCEICGKGFQRDQNLQLHRRGHNLPWKLRQRSSKELRKRVYVCPEKSCVHHDPTRALGDLTGIKKHYCRKHGDKKWKCEKCSKRYAVQSDWKAHSKTCGTKEYRCDCGTQFSRKDSFTTHRAFCDALAQETSRVAPDPFVVQVSLPPTFPPLMRGSDSQWLRAMDAGRLPVSGLHQLLPSNPADGYTSFLNSCLAAKGSAMEFGNCSSLYGAGLVLTSSSSPTATTSRSFSTPASIVTASGLGAGSSSNRFHQYHQEVAHPASAHMSATALLQKATEIGAMSITDAFLRGNSAVLDQGPQPFLGNHSVGLLQQEQSLQKNTELSSSSTGTSRSLRSEMMVRKRDSGDGETRDFLGVGDGGSLFVMPKSNVFIN
ncbi:zinc finger protein NUTCRACKER-like [Nymphaea colorata]|nr:zinc finger protein NUTCRACKER-like [Nymphaea colorata]